MNAQPPVRAPRPSGSSSLPSRIFTLSDILSKSKPQAKRIGLYAKGGFGKTSIGAYFPKPIFLMTRGETGLLTLIDAGQLPETPYLPELKDWADLDAALDLLLSSAHEYRTLCLDTVNGAERLCHEHTCHVEFSDEWGEGGFEGYKRGYEVALAPWRLFLNKLDRLREEKSMTILLLMHGRTKGFKNPVGADYDKWVPELNDRTWAVVKGWLDATMFGDYEVVVSDAKGGVAKPGKKGKAAQMSTRMLYTSAENPVYDVKNRYGLPDEIEMGDSPVEAFRNLSAAFAEAKKKIDTKPEIAKEAN